MPGVSIKPIRTADKDWVKKITKQTFGSKFVYDAGRKKFPHKLPGFVAYDKNERVGLVTFEIMSKECEIVSIESLRPGEGIGSLLLNKVLETARSHGCKRIWLITTNDNLNALRFYQNRGFVLKKIYPGAVTKTRETIKPEIPLIGEGGIPIRDEIELEYRL